MRSAWWDGDWPVTQEYGCTAFAEEGPDPRFPDCPSFHEGLDLGMPRGTPVRSPSPLTCVLVGAGGYGPQAVVLTDGTWDFWLGHGYQALVAPGQRTSSGQAVMLSDSLGFSTGDHLHFEVRPRGAPYRTAVDPAPWLVGQGPLPVVSPPSPPSEDWVMSQSDLDRIYGALQAHDGAIRQLQGEQDWDNVHGALAAHDEAIRRDEGITHTLDQRLGALQAGQLPPAVLAALQKVEAAVTDLVGELTAAPPGGQP